jgi:protein-S-isoprenylcysteine O-methyltransferase Ste14
VERDDDESLEARCEEIGQRLCNILTGLSVLSWGVLGFVNASPSERWSSVRISITILQFLVGTLFLIRRPLLTQASWRQIAACLPSFVAAGMAFKLAQPCEAWPIYAQIVFASGAAAACVSLATLGRSFAVLPAFRGLVANGPYRLVRHPAYAAELIMFSAYALAAPTLLVIGALTVGVLMMILRIRIEEHFLSGNSGYLAYRQKVRHRLIPWVW